jgi:hypothetical protein
VLNRWLLLLVAVANVAASRAEVSAAASVELQLYPLSGEVRLANPNSTQFDFVFYEVASTSGAFTGVPADWSSISDNYDASGDGSVDPVNQWIKLSATASNVAEGLFVGSGSNLAAHRSISLGAIWDPELVKPNDVDVTILDGNSQPADAGVVISLLGDYNRDLTVDALDYIEWRTAIGSTTASHADGNFDGIVDAADYTVWRDNFGLSLAGAGYGTLQSVGGAAAVAVPEPLSLWLVFWAASAWAYWRSRRRRSV